jgi:hypothetical protein
MKEAKISVKLKQWPPPFLLLSMMVAFRGFRHSKKLIFTGYRPENPIWTPSQQIDDD